MSSRIDPPEAASILAPAVQRAEEIVAARHALVGSLAFVAGRLDAAEGARICRQAARVLAAALGQETNTNARTLVLEDLALLASRLEKTEAAQICCQATQVLEVAFAGGGCPYS